jgi:hypothetical protein
MRNLLGFPSKKKEKGGAMPNQPSGESSAAGPSTTQARASTSKQPTTGRDRSVLGALLPRAKTPSTRPTTPTPQPIAVIDTTEQQHSGEGVMDTPGAGKLTSKQAEILPEATATNKQKILFLELGIRAIDLLSDVSDIADIALPNPVGTVLGKVTVVLDTLKVCTPKLTRVYTD